MMDSVTRLMELISTGASPQEIEQEIQRHVELALRIVCVAGSPAFSAREIKSMRHAIELLGYDQLQSIIATIGLFSSASKKNLVVGMSKERFQKRCLLIAMLSRMVATRLGVGEEETHYMAGLLQECGYIALATYVPDRLVQVIGVAQRTDVNDISELETYYLGFDHQAAGLTMAEEYRFGQEIAQAIGHHHHPHLADTSLMVYADIGHFASWVADEVGYPIFDSVAPAHLDRYVARRLGVDEESYRSLFAKLKQATETTYNAMRAM
jgi:HD-like signal output (HDOD) protein